MPCLKEEPFLLLEHSLTVRPQHDVDALVARIGQALQLNTCGRSGAPPLEESPAPPSCGCVRGRAAPYALCGRLQHRGPPNSVAPHNAPATGGKKQLCGRGWIRSGAAYGESEEEDPHRLLQQLLLSGDLIKEAVRRLQHAASRAEPVQ